MTKIERFVEVIPEMFADSKRMMMHKFGQQEKDAELSALTWIKALVETEIEFFDFKMEKPGGEKFAV